MNADFSRQKIVATRFWKGGRLLIMLGRKKSFWRGKRAGIWITFSIIILSALCVSVFEPASPDGIYYDEGIACGHGTWIFKDGEIFTKCDTEPPQRAGIYFKAGNKWMTGTDVTNQIVIRPSVFGITVIGSQLKNGNAFWPRDCFSWVIDCKEWIGSHLFP